MNKIEPNNSIYDGIDVSSFPTPSFVINLEKLENNLKVLQEIQNQTEAKVILALKGFAFTPAAKLISSYLSGTTSSGLHELLLATDFFPGEKHVFSPAYDERSFATIVEHADHIIFNTPNQWQKFKSYISNSTKKTECGIRINPEYSEVETPIYNPCYKHSRLGTTFNNFNESILEGISGLHFHTLCEQNSDVLERTLEHVELKFSNFIRNQCKWVNFGGGHHITRPDYNRQNLVKILNKFTDKYKVKVYLEPGEAVGLNCGVLLAQVLDTMENEMNIAILDTSASTHMPDVLEMPYRPQIVGAGLPGEKKYTYRLAGLTCLAGDIIGDYSFDQKLTPGTKLVFLDMGHYSMVKTNTFNGVQLPAICSYNPSTKSSVIHKAFNYSDYASRLG